jgi:hypothetical protein
MPQNATGRSASTTLSYVPVGEGGVQLRVRTGEPPVQPAGEEPVAVRVCMPLDEQVFPAE